MYPTSIPLTMEVLQHLHFQQCFFWNTVFRSMTLSQGQKYGSSETQGNYIISSLLPSVCGGGGTSFLCLLGRYYTNVLQVKNSFVSVKAQRNFCNPPLVFRFLALSQWSLAFLQMDPASVSDAAESQDGFQIQRVEHILIPSILVARLSNTPKLYGSCNSLPIRKIPLGTKGTKHVHLSPGRESPSQWLLTVGPRKANRSKRWDFFSEALYFLHTVHIPTKPPIQIYLGCLDSMRHLKEKEKKKELSLRGCQNIFSLLR